MLSLDAERHQGDCMKVPGAMSTLVWCAQAFHKEVMSGETVINKIGLCTNSCNTHECN